MDLIKFAWVLFALPMGWLFALLASHRKDSKIARTHIWNRFREYETTQRALELSINSIEQKYITDANFRYIIKEEFEPIRQEYQETKKMLQLVAKNLVTLEKEIIKLLAQTSE